MNLARAVRISGDGGQEGRHVADRKLKEYSVQFQFARQVLLGVGPDESRQDVHLRVRLRREPHAEQGGALPRAPDGGDRGEGYGSSAPIAR